jgi:gluconolactonase
VVAPNGWIMNVCSFPAVDPSWPVRGGDISATHVSRPLETRTVFNSSTGDVSGIPAALAFGPDDCLYVADEGRRAVVRVAPDGVQTDFISSHQGRPLNGPNDLSFDPAGNLFFTDPWGSSPDKPIGQIFGYEWATGRLSLVDSGMQFPNGIVVRDGRLYAAETHRNCVWTYDVSRPGRAANKRLFCRMPDASDTPVRWNDQPLVGPDGMAFDQAGNLYVTHIGSGQVLIYDRDGREIDAIKTPGPKPTNVCFGGAGYDELFVTQDDSSAVLRYRLGIPGHRLSFCPSLNDHHPWAAMLPAVG